jgi:hypothetical protein
LEGSVPSGYPTDSSWAMALLDRKIRTYFRHQYTAMQIAILKIVITVTSDVGWVCFDSSLLVSTVIADDDVFFSSKSSNLFFLCL